MIDNITPVLPYAMGYSPNFFILYLIIEYIFSLLSIYKKHPSDTLSRVEGRHPGNTSSIV
jgi:hypothetical protein